MIAGVRTLTPVDGNADQAVAVFVIILALAYFLTSLSFALVAARSARRPVRRHPTDLCPRCRSITWTGGLCHRCEPPR